jgi:hypothetical protein
LRAQIYEEFRQFVWNCLHKKASHCAVFCLFVFKWGEYKTRLESLEVKIKWGPGRCSLGWQIGRNFIQGLHRGHRRGREVKWAPRCGQC